MRTDEVLHVSFRFQEFSDAPVERHASWIDWDSEEVRHERAFPGNPITVWQVVTGGTAYEGDTPTLQVPDFELGALPPSLHLFQTLTLPGASFVQPLQHDVSVPGGFERYAWAVEVPDNEAPGGALCVAVRLEIDAATSLPVRSFQVSCQEGEPGRAFVTEYEVFEVVDRDTLPPDHFDPAAVTR